MKVGTICCPEKFVRNYHSSLHDNTEEKISHYVWVSSKDKVYVIFLVNPTKQFHS
jgi:hypothetical protein